MDMWYCNVNIFITYLAYKLVAIVAVADELSVAIVFGKVAAIN
jgi:hypothetical protein